MKDYIPTAEALGHVQDALAALESAYTKHVLSDAACMAYLDLIDARYRLERAIDGSGETTGETVTDDDYNLRGF